jgi:transcriptional regulator with XRE-family HTH domain
MRPARVRAPLKSASQLGGFIGRRRKRLGLTQKAIAETTGIESGLVSRVELGRDDSVELRAVLLVADALGLDIELRPREEGFVPIPPSDFAELGLSDRALDALSSSRIQKVDELGPLTELIQRPEFSSGAELFEIVCALERYGLSPRGRDPGQREREILRLRIVEGLTLKELGDRYGIITERARQLLAHYYGIHGTPPAARRGSRK